MTCARVRQVTTCGDTAACFTYSWRDDDWSACSVDVRQQCGVGVQSRQSVCVRNDGFTVDDVLCEHDEGTYAATQTFGPVFSLSNQHRNMSYDHEI